MFTWSTPSRRTLWTNTWVLLSLKIHAMVTSFSAFSLWHWRNIPVYRRRAAKRKCTHASFSTRTRVNEIRYIVSRTESRIHIDRHECIFDAAGPHGGYDDIILRDTPIFSHGQSFWKLEKQHRMSSLFLCVDTSSGTGSVRAIYNYWKSGIHQY